MSQRSRTRVIHRRQNRLRQRRLFFESVESTLALNVVNELEDTDFESLAFDAGSDGEVKAGDILVAIVHVNLSNTITGINTVADSSTTATLNSEYFETTSAFTAVSLIKVAADPTIFGGGTKAGYAFTAPTPAEWVTHTGLTSVDSGTLAVVFDDPPGSPHIDENAAGGVAGSIGTATEGTRLWELGFAGLAGEFWTATVEDDFFPDPDGAGPIPGGFNPTRIDSITDLDFIASLNVIDANGALPLLKHRALGDPDLSGANAFFFDTDSAMHLQGQLQSGSTGNFDLKTDTNFYIKPTNAVSALGDFVWQDTNADGIQDGSELGIDGVMVKLYEDVDGDGVAEPGGDDNGAVDTTTTAAGGKYLFTGLTPGGYFVEFVLPADKAFTTQDVGSDETIDSDADPTTGFTDVVTLASGETNLDVDAGLVTAAIDIEKYVKPPQSGSAISKVARQ